MSESVAFTYDGSNGLTATITNAQVGVEYQLSSADGSDVATADVSPFLLTVPDAGGVAGIGFEATVTNTGTGEVVGTTVFRGGATAEYTYNVTWAYDGVNTLTVTGVFENGTTYYMYAVGPFGYSATNGATGTGVEQTFTMLSTDGGGGTIAGSTGRFGAGLYVIPSTTDSKSNRLFSPDVAGAGSPGNPGTYPPVSTGLSFTPYPPTTQTFASASATTQTFAAASATTQTFGAATPGSQTFSPASAGSETFTPASPN